MSNLFNISTEFAELFAKFDEINAMEFDTDADGNNIDAYGNIIEDVVDYKNQMLDTWFDTLTGIEGEFNMKAAEIAVYIKQLRAEADALKAESDALKRRYEIKCRTRDGVIRYLMTAMQSLGIEKIDEPKAKISIRFNPESVIFDDEDAFVNWAQTNDRDELLRYSTPTVNKTAIKALIKSGEKLNGVRIERTQRLEVK